MSTKNITQFICSYLQSNGWILFERPCAALAYKRYKSAVGPKEAQVYFSGKDDGYNRLLSGQYYSQGRNILEPGGQLIPNNCNAHALYELVMKFTENLELTMADSYAVRLLRNS